MNNTNTDLDLLLSPTVEGLGYTLWGIEKEGQGSNSVLRIYIDKSTGIINVDDCVEVSHQIDSLLEVQENDYSHSTLEVSSPGMDRRFFKSEQLLGYIGETLSIKLSVGIDGRKNFISKLISVSEKTINVLQDGKDYTLNLSAINKAQLRI